MTESKVESLQILLDSANEYLEAAVKTTGGADFRSNYATVATGFALTAIAQMMLDERTMPRKIGVAVGLTKDENLDTV